MRQIEPSKKCNHCIHHGRVCWEKKIDHRCEKVECKFKDRYLTLRSLIEKMKNASCGRPFDNINKEELQ